MAELQNTEETHSYHHAVDLPSDELRENAGKLGQAHSIDEFPKDEADDGNRPAVHTDYRNGLSNVPQMQSEDASVKPA